MTSLEELRESVDIHWLSNINEIEKLQERWRYLELTTKNRTTFSCYDWVICWYRHYGKIYGRPLLGVAEIANKVVGIAPLVARKGTLGKIPIVSADFVGFNSESGEFLVADGMEELVTLFLELLFDVPKVDVIILNGFEEDSKEFTFVKKIIDAKCFAHELIFDRYAMVDLRNGYPAYLSSLKSKIRNSYKRHKKKITKAGQWDIEQINGNVDDNTVLRGVERIFSIYNRSWKAKENGELGEPHRSFYKDVALKFARRGMVDLCFLKLHGEDIAFVFCLVERNCYYDVKVSYDEDYAYLSPGIFLMHELIKKLPDAVINTVISHGDREYKKNWVTTFITRYRVFIFNKNIKGKLSHNIKFKLPKLVARLRRRF